MTLAETLERALGAWGQRAFLVHGTTETSYEQFGAGVRSLAASLANLGVRHGDGVLTVLPSGPEMLYCWFALARLGAVMLPVNPALVPSEVEPLLHRFGPRALIGEPAILDRYTGRLRPVLRVAVGDGAAPGALAFSELVASGGEPPPDRTKPWDPCMVLQTSGTTDRPKGAVLSHLSYVWPASEFGRWMEVVPEDRFFGCLPLFHLAGQAFAVSALTSGASLVLVDRFRAQVFWDQVRRARATLVRHLGEMLAVLCARPARPDDREHGLRAIYGGGARQAVAEEFESRFGVPVVEGYGLSETNTVLRNTLDGRRHGSLGQPLPYSRVRVADERGVELPPHVTGEIQVERNPVMMLGYLGDSEQTDASFVQQWFRTGDLGYRNEDGWFFFVGRSNNVIRRRGENIHPAHIERILDQHPAIVESAVVGVADRFGGEEIKAYVVLRRGARLPPQALVEWCRTRLAEFEIPRFWTLCRELPRTPTYKIRRRGLAEVDPTGVAFDCHTAGGLLGPAAEVDGLASGAGGRQELWSIERGS